MREWKAAHKDQVNLDHRYRHIKTKYGLSPEQYHQLFVDQKNQCLICREDVQPFSGVRGSAVDHNHRTGQVRGILCASCNVGLGMFKEDPKLLEQAIQYLKEE